MPKLGPSGLSVSSTHTPQAQDDYVITFDNVADTIDVLANDGGGNSASLFSLDQSFSLTPELTGLSSLGAFIGISNGEVTYDPTQSLALDSLVLGQQLQDSFIYWERLGNGTLSSATVHVTVEGTVKPLIGVVEDGYISGATVFVDSNGNGLFDPGIDPSATTDSNGNFTLATSLQGPLIALGGTNIDTGLPNTLTFTAPNGATVINPLTTVIETLVAGGMTASDAGQLLLSSFRVSPDVNLLTYDPLAAGDDNAASVQKGIAEIDNLLTAGVRAGISEGSLVDALSSLLATNHTVDLTDETTIKSIFSTAGVSNGLLALTDLVTTQNGVIASANTVAAVAADQLSLSGSNPNVIQAGLGHHTITASGTETIYLSNASDNVILAQGGNYTIWNADLNDFFNFGQMDIAENDLSEDSISKVNDILGAATFGVNSDGISFIQIHLDPGADNPSAGVTTITFMNSDISPNIFYPYFGDQWFGTPATWAFDSTEFGDPNTSSVPESNDLISPLPVPHTWYVTGANNGFDLSTGGADVLHIAGGTGITTVWGFDPSVGDILDVSGTAAGSGGWSQFAAAVQSTGHQGSDALGNEYYEFSLGNADVVMMGVTASQFSQMESNHGTFGF